MKSLVLLHEDTEIYVCVKFEEVVIAVESQKESTLISQKKIRKCMQTKNIPCKYLLNYGELNDETKKQLILHKFQEAKLDKENETAYEKAFFKEFLSYIKKRCTIDNVCNPTGEKITNYINLKEAFENRDYLFKISYLLSEKIVRKVKNKLESFSLFCHTLNGACLAENLSLMLGINLLYADRLNTTGQMRKMFMPDHIESHNRIIIVTDIVCQGHEIHRAIDIIKMMGGNPELYVGVIDLGIHNKSYLSSNIFLKVFNKADRDALEYIVTLEDS